MAAKRPQYGYQWRRLREEVLRVYGPWCYLCGEEIDLTAPPRAARSFSADHLDAVHWHGTDTPDITRVRPVHYGCNSGKREGRDGPVTSPTSREW